MADSIVRILFRTVTSSDIMRVRQREVITTLKPAIQTLDHQALSDLILSAGEPKYRVSQIEQWLYAKRVTSFDGMTNLPASLREELASRFVVGVASVAAKQISSDNTRKYLVSFDEHTAVETVGIPSTDGTRLSVCVSTQAGCAMGCAFCATGQSGFTRNLDTWEIYEQVRVVEEDFGSRVNNVVAMGQGEPFANYEATLQALRMVNNPKLLNIGARHITVSTCGILPGIERFAQEPEQFTLAVSLHSAIQKTRDRLMPGASAYTLPELKSTLKKYGDTTKRRPSLEYAPIAGINDDNTHMDALVTFCHGMLAHVNLIPLNPISIEDGTVALEPSPRLRTFENALKDAGIEVSVRASRGADIDGACGQLRQHVAE